MSAEQNKVLARRVVEELFNHDGNLATADELFSSGYVCYVAGFEDLHGADAVKQFAATERQAIPDLKNTVEDQVAEGEKVVTRYRTQGTHTGETEAFGPPTGNRIDIQGMVIDRVGGGKIAESWIVYDALGMMRQLGFIPERAAAGRELRARASHIQEGQGIVLWPFLLPFIHRSAEKVHSANLAMAEFCELRVDGVLGSSSPRKFRIALIYHSSA